MKIIEKGTKKISENNKRCSKCKCLFTYTEKDINVDKDGDYVICPQCGSYIAIAMDIAKWKNEQLTQEKTTTD